MTEKGKESYERSRYPSLSVVESRMNQGLRKGRVSARWETEIRQFTDSKTNTVNDIFQDVINKR